MSHPSAGFFYALVNRLRYGPDAVLQLVGADDSRPSAAFAETRCDEDRRPLSDPGLIIAIPLDRELTFDFVDDRMTQVLRQKTEAQRLAIAHGMWSHARKMLLAVRRDEHPDWSAIQIQQEAAHRLSHGAV